MPFEWVRLMSVKVGICPTMMVFAEKLAGLFPDFEIYNLGSAAAVLYYLSNKQIDVGLVGRRAKKVEFNGYYKELEDKDGYTLVSRDKGSILYKDLDKLVIRTTLSPDLVKEKYPELKKVEYYSSLPSSLDEEEIRLISWNDWQDDYELLIPVDERGNKILSFRKPYVFSYNKDLVEETVKRYRGNS